jgi:hypothetical protein
MENNEFFINKIRKLLLNLFLFTCHYPAKCLNIKYQKQQVPTHFLLLFATSAGDLPDSVKYV